MVRSSGKWWEHLVGCFIYLWSDRRNPGRSSLSLWPDRGFKTKRRFCLSTFLPRSVNTRHMVGRASGWNPQPNLWDVYFETKTIEGSRPYRSEATQNAPRPWKPVPPRTRGGHAFRGWPDRRKSGRRYAPGVAAGGVHGGHNSFDPPRNR